MSVRWPFVYASVLTAGLLGSSGIAAAEELGPEQARVLLLPRSWLGNLTAMQQSR